MIDHHRGFYLNKVKVGDRKYRRLFCALFMETGIFSVFSPRINRQGLPRYFTKEQFDSFVRQEELQKYIRAESKDPENAVTLSIFTQEWIVDRNHKMLFCNPQIGNVWGTIAKLDAEEWSDF